MINDRNGYVTIEFKDVNNKHLDGDFDLIPNDAVTATIKETVITINELGGLNRTVSSYRVILGNPVYRIDDIILVNDIMSTIQLNESPIIVVGRMHEKGYAVLSSEKDIVVTSREEFIRKINEIGSEFLEKLDYADAVLRLNI